jgi:5-methyltetrahydrofolate--homocysteine methyltransferase
MARERLLLLDALRSGRVLLMDGAMGTELQGRGLKPDENASTWLFLHPESVREVHLAYLNAGAVVLLSNTFLVNARSFDSTPDKLSLWRRAYELLGPAPYRLADLGPVAGEMGGRDFDDLSRPLLPPEFPGVFDAVLLETCSSPRARYAVRRCAEHGPVLLSLTYQRKGGRLVTASGHGPEWFAARARGYGAAALGVNCGREIGMDDVIEIVRRYRRETDLPLFARPNAGTPRRSKGRLVYPLTPAQMAARLPELMEAGAVMVGGCCGTTPAHIAACRTVIDDWNWRQLQYP